MPAGGWAAFDHAIARLKSQDTYPKSAFLCTMPFVPHEALLGCCNAVLHSGGVGTCAAAAAAGVPQIIMPAHFDQFMWVWALSCISADIKKVITNCSVVCRQRRWYGRASLWRSRQLTSAICNRMRPHAAHLLLPLVLQVPSRQGVSQMAENGIPHGVVHAPLIGGRKCRRC